MAWTIRNLRRWAKELKAGKPGRRFQDHYARVHEAHGGQRRKPVFIWIGAGLVVLGIVFSVLPLLPGWLMVLLGVAAISAQSHSMAKSLDWLEVRARELLG